jgi:hypothetical protein
MAVKGEKEGIIDLTIDGHLAFVITQIKELKVNKERGGLSDQGEVFYNNQLQKDAQPALEALQKNPTIKALSREYHEEILEELREGTTGFQLNEQDRDTFIFLLRLGDAKLSDYLAKQIQTSMTI